MCNNHDKEKAKVSKIASSLIQKRFDFELENHTNQNAASLEQKHHSNHSKTKKKNKTQN